MLVIEPELLGTKIFLAKVTPKISQKKYLLLILCFLGHNYRTKDLNGEKITGSF